MEAHDIVGSTNALALERARTGDLGKLWITALQQEAGRGRRGRSWSSPYGNLAASLLVTLDAVQHPATLGFVAGLALTDALAVGEKSITARVGVDGAHIGAKGRFSLKWPNDVLADGAKLAGVLLESISLGGGRFAVAVGIGVNVVAHPDGLPYPATSLRELGGEGDAAALFEALSSAWATNYSIWYSPSGLRAVRDRWLRHAAGLGSDVAIQLDGEVVRGTFETIDEHCRFVLRERSGERKFITAGDVHFGIVATAANA